MPDKEPRFRLVDADGNVVGSLFAESDGTLKLQEGTSGNDREASLSTDGEFTTRSLNTEDLSVGNKQTTSLDGGDGVSQTYATYTGDNDFSDKYRKNVVVDTSATEISSLSGPLSTGIALIFGDAGDSQRFHEAVLWGRTSGGAAVLGTTDRKSPPARTYGSDVGNESLTLSLASGDADVNTRLIEVR